MSGGGWGDKGGTDGGKGRSRTRCIVPVSQGVGGWGYSLVRGDCFYDSHYARRGYICVIGFPA